MPEAKVKAEIEKPLSPEFQANRSMFRYRPESRKRNFLKSYRECHVKCPKISISCEKGEVSNFLGKKFSVKMICKKLKTNFRSGGEVPENIEIET